MKDRARKGSALFRLELRSTARLNQPAAAGKPNPKVVSPGLEVDYGALV